MFEVVFGHQRIKDVLSRMVSRDRLHHGLCFYGPAGIGKRLVGQQVARAMLCETREGCGTCKHCRKFDGGNHPDYREVVPDGADIKVDQIREISENLHYRPFEGRCRVILLDGVERLREESANAFLKSLEEPPDYVYFVLITNDIKALLPTIRSRCQKIAFQSLTEADKAGILEKRFGIEPVLAERLASISFARLETEASAWDDFLHDARKIITFFRLMLDEGHAIDYLSEIVRDKQVWPRFQDHLLVTTRELTLIAANLPTSSRFKDLDEEMRHLAARAPHASWRAVWQELVELGGKRRLHLNLALWFNAMSVVSLNLLEREEGRVKALLAKSRR